MASASSDQTEAGYIVGEKVEYFSASQGTWILARVTKACSYGSYDLDCKKGVTSEKIRKVTKGGVVAAVGSRVMTVSASMASTASPSMVSSPATASSANPVSAWAIPEYARTSETHSASAAGTRDSRVDVEFSLADDRLSRSTLVQLEPTQLLRVQRMGEQWQFEVCADGARLLESHGARRISVASICGLYRTGKSYILNLLLERVQRNLPLFQVGNTTRACTEGLWLWGSIEGEDAASPLLAFIDCEGFGSTESDRTRDAQLMTLCALLSSVLVLNTRGALNESLFNALALTCRFAEHVETRGNEASRPELLWLLRDFQLDLIDPSGRPISPSDYLEQALHSGPVNQDSDRGQAAIEVRQSLLRFFGQRRCMTLVRPVAEEEQLRTLATVPYAALRSEFQQGVEALRAQLIQSCRLNPKCVGGQTIGCGAFIALMRQLVNAMNNNTVLNVRSAWETVQHHACVDLTDKLRERAVGTLRKLSGGQQLDGGYQLPMTDVALNELLCKQRSALKDYWDSNAMGDEVVRREYWRELEEALVWEETAVRSSNVRLADQQLSEQGKLWLAWLNEEGAAGLTCYEPTEGLVSLLERAPSAPACRAVKSALEAAGHRVAKQRDQLKAVHNMLSDAEQRATALRNAVAEEEANAQLTLWKSNAEMEEQLSELSEALQLERSARVSREMELQRTDAENGQARAADLQELMQLREQLNSVSERLHSREVELKETRGSLDALRSHEREEVIKLNRAHAEREQSWRESLDWIKAAAAKAESERIASERAARKARWEADTALEARRWLEEEVKRLAKAEEV
eukprot:CAMPEP_0171126132 /NCGR_PEP_ID=MMETSP0766_2-20121228/112703_1 /TAXON_ID=439317 /ORGANISM="Gambierdiscus australes, Strain CAWD 149" /LENGTH=807 /DNA_ID=CAMNT_0011589149 /DNA_START=102 /DNA_END=2522 /DNA_ORIENTATION=-